MHAWTFLEARPLRLAALGSINASFVSATISNSRPSNFWHAVLMVSCTLGSPSWIQHMSTVFLISLTHPAQPRSMTTHHTTTIHNNKQQTTNNKCTYILSHLFHLDLYCLEHRGSNPRLGTCKLSISCLIVVIILQQKRKKWRKEIEYAIGRYRKEKWVYYFL